MHIKIKYMIRSSVLLMINRHKQRETGLCWKYEWKSLIPTVARKRWQKENHFLGSFDQRSMIE